MLSKDQQDKFLDGLPDDASIADMAALTLVTATVYELTVEDFKALILMLAVSVERGSYEKMIEEHNRMKRMH